MPQMSEMQKNAIPVKLFFSLISILLLPLQAAQKVKKQFFVHRFIAPITQVDLLKGTFRWVLATDTMRVLSAKCTPLI